MRKNFPVTGNEYQMRDGMTIVSRTDLKGRITFVNADFIEASGFTEAELMGQPHNLLRHPDMPEEGFADLWRTIQAGRPWTGVVKNRRKNGDHYWVIANVTPLLEGSTITGYLSVRTRPSRELIDACAAAYKEFTEGRAKGLTIREGKVFARAPGGHLQFRSAGLRDYGAANPALQLVVQALDDFQFDQLDSDLSYDEDGKLQLALHLSGRNPAIEEGRLINFNIHLEENLPALITSLQLSERVSETIRERVRERVEGKSSKPGKKKARD